MTKQLIKYCLLANLFIGCSPKELPPKAFAQWVANERNGLSAKKETQGLEFKLQYEPPEMRALKQMAEQQINQQALDTLLSEERLGIEYYRLRVTNQAGKGGILKYGNPSGNDALQRRNYFGHQIREDMVMVVGTDTFKTEAFHFVNQAGLVPHDDFLLGYEVPKGKAGDRTLIYWDFILGLKETIVLTINEKSMNKIPKLKI